MYAINSVCTSDNIGNEEWEMILVWVVKYSCFFERMWIVKNSAVIHSQADLFIYFLKELKGLN